MLVFLSGPIDGAPDKGGAWRLQVSAMLNGCGHHAYSPSHAFFLSSAGDTMKVARQVEAINRFAIRQCDVVLAYLPKNRRTVGTPREIEYARTLGKPVVAVVGEPVDQHISLWDVRRVATFEEAVHWIEGLSRRADAEGNDHSPGDSEGSPRARGEGPQNAWQPVYADRYS